MTEFNNENRGVLFKKQDRDKDTDAIMTGELDVGGQKLWVTVWPPKESKKGVKYYPVTVKPKGEPRKANKPIKDDMDDTIPF